MVPVVVLRARHARKRIARPAALSTSHGLGFLRGMRIETFTLSDEVGSRALA